MSGYVIAAAKATSAFFVVWSAYLFVRKRSIMGRSSTDDDLANKRKHYSHESINTVGQPSSEGDLHSPEATTILSQSCDTTDNTLGDRRVYTASNTTNSQLSFIRQRLGLLLDFIRLHNLNNKADDSVQNSRTSIKLSPESQEQLNCFLEFVCQLATKSITASEAHSLVKSINRRIRSTLPRGTLQTLLEALTEYSKDPNFLEELFNNQQTNCLISWLITITLETVPNSCSSTNSTSSPDDDSLQNTAPYINDFLLNDNHLMAESVSIAQSDINHPEYPVHLGFATLLAHLSRHQLSANFLELPDLLKLLSHWNASPSLHLALISRKIQHNLTTHKSYMGDHQSQSKVIFYPEIYQLDTKQDDKHDYQFDIIFVNGMLGSVFYTWRQHDSALKSDHLSPGMYTKCWPRDWLASEFPQARIIGVDTSLKPFIWNQLCATQKLRRTLNNRAVDIMDQLRYAGVGSRPIIWITHSAGGILVKEMLRLAHVTKYPSSTTNGQPTCKHTAQVSISPPLTRQRRMTGGETFHANSYTEQTEDSGICLPKWSHYDLSSSNAVNVEAQETVSNLCSPYDVSSPESLSTLVRTTIEENLYESANVAFPHGADLSEHNIDYQNLAKQTTAIVFMSTPHRGNRSMFTLYRRPFRWALTPEAIQLERNSDYLLDLHVWFNIWAYVNGTQVLSMTETRLTRVNRFWSVLLVPEDNRDREMGEVVHVDSDHLYISKPKSPTDPAYMSIVNFIERLPCVKNY